MTNGLKEQNTIWNDIIVAHYSKNKGRLVKMLYWIGDGAEDVVQDAYERSIRYASSFNGENFDRWFNTILRNAASDYRKMDRGTSESEELDEYDHIGNYCLGFENKMWEEVFVLIESKTPDHAEVLNLYFNQGYSYKDIAAVTDNTYFNAYRIVERFKKELIERYKE